LCINIEEELTGQSEQEVLKDITQHTDGAAKFKSIHVPVIG